MDLQKTCDKIFELQNEMNCKVNPDWVNADYEWYRAAWIESAELSDALGYKWWKATNVDKDQAGLELVDIFHFMVSDMTVNGYDSTDLANAIFSFKSKRKLKYTDEEKLYAVDQFAESVLMSSSVLHVDLLTLIRELDYDIDWILAWYIGKNALNMFRQNHGYKDGTYIKQWNGREDNTYLADIINSGVVDFDEIYQQLENNYPKQ